jgi:hypothetical protein
VTKRCVRIVTTTERKAQPKPNPPRAPPPARGMEDAMKLDIWNDERFWQTVIDAMTDNWRKLGCPEELAKENTAIELYWLFCGRPL